MTQVYGGYHQYDILCEKWRAAIIAADGKLVREFYDDPTVPGEPWQVGFSGPDDHVYFYRLDEYQRPRGDIALCRPKSDILNDLQAGLERPFQGRTGEKPAEPIPDPPLTQKSLKRVARASGGWRGASREMFGTEKRGGSLRDTAHGKRDPTPEIAKAAERAYASIPKSSEDLQTRVLVVLRSHTGPSRIINKYEVAKIVRSDKDGERVRKAITILREKGHPICSRSERPAGYWWPESLEGFIAGTADYRSRLKAIAESWSAMKATALEMFRDPTWPVQQPLELPDDW